MGHDVYGYICEACERSTCQITTEAGMLPKFLKCPMGNKPRWVQTYHQSSFSETEDAPNPKELATLGRLFGGDTD